MTMRKQKAVNIPRELQLCPKNHGDCHSCVFGYCTLLERFDFGDKECPFYKTNTQFQKDFDASIERLKEIDRMDLIYLYHLKEAKKIEREQAKS